MYRIYLGYRFLKIGKIKLEKCGGKIRTHCPQKGIDIKKQQLNKYAKGRFCFFKIASSWQGKAGLYIFIVRDVLKYFGECDDLYCRLYDYGNISARECHDDGQATNCKINGLILKNSKKHSVNLWFCNTRQASRRKRKKIERRLIEYLHPPWNGRMA
jgi:hypothetical protein